MRPSTEGRRSGGVARQIPVPIKIATTVDALGSGMFAPVMMLFYVSYRGLDIVDVALALSVSGVAGVGGLFAVGELQKRFGATLIYRASCLTAIAGYLAALKVDALWSAAVVLCVIRLANRALRPAMNALIWEAQRDGLGAVRSAAVLRSLRNLAFAVAGLISGGCVMLLGREGYPTLLLLNVASYLIALLALRNYSAGGDTKERPGPGPTSEEPALSASGTAALAIWNGLLAINRSMLTIGLPLVIAAAGLQPGLVGLMFTVNTLLVVALQVRVARAGDAASGVRSLALSGLLLGAAAALYASAPSGGRMIVSTALVIAAVIVHTVAELFYSAGEFAVMFEACRNNGRRLGIWSALSGVQDILGPLAVAAAVSRAPNGLILLGAGVVFVALAGRLAFGRLQPTAAGP